MLLRIELIALVVIKCGGEGSTAITSQTVLCVILFPCSTLKVESSPKPKRKFRVPKPNIGKNIKQKIRSRLKKGTDK